MNGPAAISRGLPGAMPLCLAPPSFQPGPASSLRASEGLSCASSSAALLRLPRLDLPHSTAIRGRLERPGGTYQASLQEYSAPLHGIARNQNPVREATL